MAQGEFVHFLDVDDYLFPNVYKEIYKCAVSTEADYVKFRSRCFSAYSGEDKSKEHKDYTCAYLNSGDFGKQVSIEDHPYELIEASTSVPWAGFFRRSFLQEHQIEFNALKCVNDRSFYIKVITNTKKIIYIDKYVVNHLIENPKSLIGNRGDNFECHFLSYNIIRDYLRSIHETIEIDLYRRILTRELVDIFLWYSCLSITQKDRIEKELYDFFLFFDWNEINKYEYIYDTMEKINSFLDKDKIIMTEKIEDLSTFVEKYEACYLYGAGVMAKYMIRYLKAENICPVSVIVTSDTNNHVLENVNINQIDYVDFPENKENILVILASKSNYHLQMLHQLKKFGIKNIVTILDKDFDALFGIWTFTYRYG